VDRDRAEVVRAGVPTPSPGLIGAGRLGIATIHVRRAAVLADEDGSSWCAGVSNISMMPRTLGELRGFFAPVGHRRRVRGDPLPRLHDLVPDALPRLIPAALVAEPGLGHSYQARAALLTGVGAFLGGIYLSPDRCSCR
jgi:hypothetical protein